MESREEQFDSSVTRP
nr:unnamed protein product [Callosobruchus chinensis]